MRYECVYCKWYKIKGAWLTECKNENSGYYGYECIEHCRYVSEPCDDKVEDYDLGNKTNDRMDRSEQK